MTVLWPNGSSSADLGHLPGSPTHPVTAIPYAVKATVHSVAGMLLRSGDPVNVRNTAIAGFWHGHVQAHHMLSSRHMANRQHKSDSCCSPLWRLTGVGDGPVLGKLRTHNRPQKRLGMHCTGTQTCLRGFCRHHHLDVTGNVECLHFTFPEMTGGAMGQ